MDARRTFTWWQLALFGVLAGVTLSLAKLMTAGFYLGGASSIEMWAALCTYACYMAMGAIGAVFLVDHDETGQKMMKQAFLMGLVAPSFFLAVFAHPTAPNVEQLREMIRSVPKIAAKLIPTAHAQDANTGSKYFGHALAEATAEGALTVLEKKDVEPSFTTAVQRAFGMHVTPMNYAYVVGSTNDAKKALAAASDMNRILVEHKGVPNARVWQPKGKSVFFVAIGELSSPERAAAVGEAAREAAIRGLEVTDSPEAKRAASLMLKGQIVDARAMFTSARE